MHRLLQSVLMAAPYLSVAAISQASTIISSSFTGVTTANVDTSAFTDWGYFSTNNSVNNGLFSPDLSPNTDFSSISGTGGVGNLTTDSGSDVTMTDLRSAMGAQTGVSGVTFSGNSAFGAYGGFPANAGDLWSITFNNLAAGDYVISLYLGHTNSARTFDVDADLTGLATDTASSGAISGLGSTVTGGGYTTFTYDISFTADANDDLTLKLISTPGGSSGGGVFNGYTVDFTAVPEPSAVLLGSLGFILLLRRRKH